DQVGLEVPVLEREELARPAETCLHLVDGKKGPVAPAERLRLRKVLRWRQVHTVTEDRLDEEHGDVLAPELLLQRFRVAERYAVESRQEWAEALCEMLVAARRQRTERQAVKASVRREHATASCRATAELERGLVRLGAGVREQH